MSTCSAVSLAADEPLAATASRIDHWILIEYRGIWNRDVLGGSTLSPAVKSHLREQLAALGRARLLFVKKPERRAHRLRQVYFGTSRPDEERLLALELEDEEELVGIDFVAALSGAAAGAARVERPLFVVCTHGKRDRCCAKNGRPLYDALRHATDPGRVWQSTHVGGDRFAGNVVVLPDGLYYGRVAPDYADALLAAQADDRVDLVRYRGRSAYSFPEQAAEQAIREAEGILAIGGLALVGTERLARGSWRVGFREPGGVVHEVDVLEEAAAEPAFLTCGAAEPRHALRYVVTASRVLRRR